MALRHTQPNATGFDYTVYDGTPSHRLRLDMIGQSHCSIGHHFTRYDSLGTLLHMKDHNMTRFDEMPYYSTGHDSPG